jgi:hypothetical protein
MWRLDASATARRQRWIADDARVDSVTALVADGLTLARRR